MFRRIFPGPALVAGLLLSGPATAGEGHPVLATRYGDIEAVAATEADAAFESIGPIAGEDHDRTAVRFGNKTLAVFEGLGVELLHVVSEGDVEYVIVDQDSPGMPWCHHQFVVVELHADAAPVLSPVFGSCAELTGVEHADAGLRIHLVRWTANDRSDEHEVIATWRDGKIEEQG
jgi:hypothetical protein